MSVITFENMFTRKPFPYPITTIDFGFDHLGFMAFHSFTGDIHVRRDRAGNIFSRPHVIRGGSVKFLGKNSEQPRAKRVG
jgi:DNA-binding LacI/PurR family transcriptional regulator